MVVLHCVQDELNWSAALEIPEWMFDSGRCSEKKAGSLAYVSLSALRELRVLLSANADHIESCVEQAQHLARDSGGADANNIPIQNPAGSTVYFPDAATETSAGSLSTDASLVGPDDEPTPGEEASCPRVSGGGR